MCIYLMIQSHFLKWNKKNKTSNLMIKFIANYTRYNEHQKKDDLDIWAISCFHWSWNWSSFKATAEKEKNSKQNNMNCCSKK